MSGGAKIIQTNTYLLEDKIPLKEKMDPKRQKLKKSILKSP